jgi:transposase
MDPVTLTAWQRRHLQRQLRDARDARLYRRTLAVLEVSRGKPVAEVAQTLGVTPRSIYYWIDSYTRAHDPQALADDARGGRPSLWEHKHRVLLRTLLGQSPQRWGYPAVDWTVPLLQEHLWRRTGRWFSDDTLRRELQRQRYVWKRSRYVLDPDPELEKKKAPASANPGPATPHRPAGGRRDRPAAVPAAAGLLVAAGASQGGTAQRSQCPAGGLRGAEPA